MKDRIYQVMKWADLSQQDFAARLEVSPASLSNIFSGRTNPTNNYIMAIHRVFPEINVSWLMFGEGTMLNEDSATAVSAMSAVPATSSSEAANSVVEIAGMPSMFTQADFEMPAQHPSMPVNPTLRSRETAGMRPSASRERETAKIIDKPVRKIKEIRVFFDDGTYEAFVPSSGK